MPYIKDIRRTKTETRRSALNPWAKVLGASDPGELNYQFTCLVLEYMKLKGVNYETLNALVGALECAKLELYRRVVAPYENKKINENGDVYYVEGVTTSDDFS